MIGAEAEATAALDDLRDSIDLDDALFERQLVGIDPGQLISSFASELEAGFASGVGQRLDPPVIPEPGAIEDHGFDTRALGALGDQATDGLGFVGLASGRAFSSFSRLEAAASVLPVVSSITWA